MEQQGFVDYEPLLVTHGDTILGGHRRWDAAKQAGIDTVPVVRVDPADETEEKRILLTDNEYRNKTPGEKVNEAEQWEDVESGKAAKRRRATQNNDSGPEVENLPQQDEGKTREKVAEKVGVSGKSYEKGKQVKKKAKPDEYDAK
jgi:ParB family chromosome partitioning protein